MMQIRHILDYILLDAREYQYFNKNGLQIICLIEQLTP